MRGSQLSISKIISFCIACVYGTVLYFGRRNMDHGATIMFLPVAFFGLAYIWFGDRIRPWKKHYFDVLYPWPTGKSFEYWPKFIGWVLLIVPFILTLLMLLEVI